MDSSINTSAAPRAASPIKIAVLAMGGQGGGVLADWIVDMAEHAGWWAQTTRCRAWPSAPAPPSITWNCCPRPTSNAPAARPRWR